MTAPLFGAPEPAPLVPPVTYLPGWLDTHAATFAWCERSLPWEHRVFRDDVKMPRLECWLGPAGASYVYSGVKYRARELARHPISRLVDRVNAATEPVVGTGAKEDRACGSCGAVVTHHEVVGMYGSGLSWRTGRHLAPCGLPCMRGGVTSQQYRSEQVHGRWGWPEHTTPADAYHEAELVPARAPTPCPACGATGPVIG